MAYPISSVPPPATGLLREESDKDELDRRLDALKADLKEMRLRLQNDENNFKASQLNTQKSFSNKLVAKICKYFHNFFSNP